MQRRTFLALACAALVATCGPAPGSRPASGPALWRVHDADSDVYLFGTVHVLPQGLSWKSPSVRQAFARAGTIWFETRTDDAAGAKIAAFVAAHGVNPPGVTLSSQLAPDDRARLARVTAMLALDRAALERMRPWVAALQLSLALLQKQGRAADAGVEQALEADAAAQGKQTAYFETAEDQLRIFTTLSAPAERRFLTSTLRQIEEDADSSDRMDGLWARGQAHELGVLILEQAEEAGPDTAEALIYQRNRAWADRIDEIMAGKGIAFVAVGAAHMAGPRGVPALLQARGHVVDGPPT